MKEDFLHFIWKFKLLKGTTFYSSSKESISILKFGFHNGNAGPDFLNAQIRINNQLWVGNVEIHVKSSDWYLHHHEEDSNYDAVILHVVWEHDVDVFRNDNSPISTLVLKDLIDKKLVFNYQKLMSNKLNWIPCETQIASIESFVFRNWQERLFFERLANKALLIESLLINSHSDFEAVLFQLLAKNFGLKVNGEAFLSLATSINFSIVRKERFDVNKLTALLFGQAGFLEEDLQNTYHSNLRTEYQYLKHKYTLKAISKNHFSFFRMRPPNFPTIRIAQLASLYNSQDAIFSKLMKFTTIKEFYTFFSFEMSAFWKSHYTFERPSKISPKKLTTSFIDLLIINTIIPLKFVYQKSKGAVNEDEILALIKQLKPEKNSIISNYIKCKVPVNSAFDTQALLELKNNYCNTKRCLECAVGTSLLQNNQ